MQSVGQFADDWQRVLPLRGGGACASAAGWWSRSTVAVCSHAATLPGRGLYRCGGHVDADSGSGRTSDGVGDRKDLVGGHVGAPRVLADGLGAAGLVDADGAEGAVGLLVT